MPVKRNLRPSEKKDRTDNDTSGDLRPTLDAQGNLSVSGSALNVPGAFTGKVNSSANIGMSTEEMVQLWNEEHSSDPIVLEAEPEPQP